MRKVTVLGAGVIGLTTAYALAKRGYAVTVIDRASGVGQAASHANGAQLSYCYTDALASPLLLQKLPAYLLGLDPALRLKLSFSPQFWGWSLSFLKNATWQRFERNTLELLEMALESRSEFAELSGKIAFKHRRPGKLTLFADETAAENARKVLRMKEVKKLGQIMLAPVQAIEIEPALENYGHPFVAALWSPMDEVGDCYLFCIGLARLLEEEFGVTFRMATEITGLKISKDRLTAILTKEEEIGCEDAVLALGVASPAVAIAAGLRLPVWPMQGYSLTVPAKSNAPEVSITDATRKLVFCRLGTDLRVAGIGDIGRGRAGFNHQRFKAFAKEAERAMPQAGDFSAENSAWTGFRPMTPSNQPLIGKTPVKGIYLNCGHGSLGWTLSMGAAKRLVAVFE